MTIEFNSPFSQAFKEGIRSMQDQVDRIEERFSQIEKSAASIQEFHGASGSDNKIRFFKITGGGSGDASVENVSGSGSEVAMRGHQYSGKAFSLRLDTSFQLVAFNVANAVAYDIYQEKNEPDDYPDVADILDPEDAIDNETIVMGYSMQSGNVEVIAFSSVLPRLSSECLEVKKPLPVTSEFYEGLPE